MLVNIDVTGDILVQAETDFERDYVRQFEGCKYLAFVKCGLTPAEVIGLKLRKTSEQGESPATDRQQLKAEIATLALELDRAKDIHPGYSTVDRVIEKMRQLSAV